MANKKGKSRQLSQYYPPPGAVQQPKETTRPRTPAETVDDAYAASIQVTALNAVTHLAYDSLLTIAQHKAAIVAEHPELAAALDAIGFNHVQGLLAIQRQVTDNERRETE